MKQFKQYLKSQIPAFICITLAFITLILHQAGIEFTFTKWGQAITLYDIGTVLLCMGLVLVLFIGLFYRSDNKRDDNKNETHTTKT